MEKTTHVRIDKELAEALRRLKDRDGVPIAESLRRAVRDYLAKMNAE